MLIQQPIWLMFHLLVVNRAVIIAQMFKCIQVNSDVFSLHNCTEIVQNRCIQICSDALNNSVIQKSYERNQRHSVISLRGKRTRKADISPTCEEIRWEGISETTVQYVTCSLSCLTSLLFIIFKAPFQYLRKKNM